MASGTEERIVVALSPELLAKLDAWIARHEEPRPDREEAVALILRGQLGGDFPSTVIPNKVTGRDIV